MQKLTFKPNMGPPGDENDIQSCRLAIFVLFYTLITIPFNPILFVCYFLVLTSCVLVQII